MKFIFSRIIIGSLVIIIGVYILLQYIFHIYIPFLASIPVFTIIVAFLIVSWGVAILFGRGFYSSKIIIGLLLILFGIYILIRYCFNVNMPFILYTPIFRMIFSIIIVFLGIYILIGVYYLGDNIPDYKKRYYRLFFKTSNIDFSNIEIDRNINITVDSIFSDTIIFINQNIQVYIKASSSFGSISLPTGDSVSFGEVNFIIGDSDKILYLNVNSAFGQIRILYKWYFYIFVIVFFFFVKKYKIKLDFSKKNYYTIKHRYLFLEGKYV